jgi:hypothetical protein
MKKYLTLLLSAGILAISNCADLYGVDSDGKGSGEVYRTDGGALILPPGIEKKLLQGKATHILYIAKATTGISDKHHYLFLTLGIALENFWDHSWQGDLVIVKDKSAKDWSDCRVYRPKNRINDLGLKDTLGPVRIDDQELMKKLIEMEM